MSKKQEFTAEQALEIAKNAVDKGDKKKASKYFHAVLQKYPENQEAIDGIRALNPNALFRSDLDDLKQLLEEKKFREVEVRCSMEIEKYPHVYELYHYLGIALGNQKKHAEALGAFKRAAELNSHNVQAHYNLGNAFNANGDLHNALASYMRAIKIEPEFAPAMHNAGGVLMQLKDYEAASEIFYQASKLYPNSFDVIFNLARSLRMRGMLDDAIIFYNRAIDLNDLEPGVFNELAICQKENGNLEEAITILESVLSQEPEYLDGLINLGSFYAEKGENELAVDRYMQALNIEKNIPGVHFNIANMNKQAGDFEYAEHAFKNALSIVPNSPQFLLGRADLFLTRGHYLESSEIYQEIDKHIPGRPVIVSNLAILSHLLNHDDDSKKYAAQITDEMLTAIEDEAKRSTCVEIKSLLDEIHDYNEKNERDQKLIDDNLVVIGDNSCLSLHGHCFNVGGKEVRALSKWLTIGKAADIASENNNQYKAAMSEFTLGVNTDADVLFMLGANDFNAESDVDAVKEMTEAYFKNAMELAAAPSAKPIFAGVTIPKGADKAVSAAMDAFNATLKELCEKESIRFVELAASENNFVSPAALQKALAQ